MTWRAVALAVVGACYSPHAPLGAPCADMEPCPDNQTCIAGKCGVGPPPSDSPVAVDGPGLIDAAPPAPSCKALHAADPTLLTGAFTIDPDGPGGDAPLVVTCDMTTAGGGWTIVFFAKMPDEMTVPIAYTSSTPRLLADATDTLLAYRAFSAVAAPGNAVLALPPAWRTDTPFDDPGSDLPVQASIDGATPIAATLHYGSASFADLCSDAWNTAAVYGRVCLDGSKGPFYSGFDEAGLDECSASDQAYDAQPCSPTRRFSIAVR